jgi:hypothetical protein
MKDSPSHGMPMPETLADVDGGGTDSPPSPFSLVNWYSGIRHVPFDKWEVSDFCRALRQDIFPEILLPYIAAELKREPEAGEFVDGDVANYLLALSDEFWLHHPDSSMTLALIHELCIPFLEVESAGRLEYLLERCRGR